MAFVRWPLGSAGKVETKVAHGPHESVEFEQRPVLLERLLEVGGLIRRPEPAPRTTRSALGAMAAVGSI